MRRKKIEFQQVPPAPENISILGSLIFDRRTTLGPKAHIDLTDIRSFQALGRDCIAALEERVFSSGITSGDSIDGYDYSIRQLLKYCAHSSAAPTLRMRDVDFEFATSYQRYITIQFPAAKSSTLRHIYGNFLRLIQAAQSIGLANQDLHLPRNFDIGNDDDVSQPYTAAEALDIENACRNDIRDLENRLATEQRLLADGRDPRIPVDRRGKGRHFKVRAENKPWNQLPNLIWYVINVMNGEYIKNPGRAGLGHSSFANATNGAWGGTIRKPTILGYLYPHAEDIIPFIVLLAKSTGRNESSIIGLERNCLQEIDGKYFMWYRKNRGHAKLYKRIISSEGPFSPVAVIQRLLKITEPLVRFAKPEFQNRLFIGLTVYGHGREPVKPLDPVYVKSQMNREGGWCQKHRLTDEHGRGLKISLRRMRVFYLTTRYKRHGQLSRVSRDAAHVLSQTTVGYVANESTKHIHEKAVEDGIRAARNIARITVVPDDAPTTTSSPLQEKKWRQAAQDVFFADCSDFYNRPGGPSNTACDRPWLCLASCGNAIVTRHVLPRVMALKLFVEGQRLELAPDDWSEKFADIWHTIVTDILPKFGQSVIAEATALAQREQYYIPLALKL